MRIKLFFAIWMFSLGMMAANNKTTCSTQITNAVQVAANTDYVLTRTSSLFSSSGTLNIPSSAMEHSVIIFQGIKPSVVKNNWLSYIRINGSRAVDGSNCQVKMYNKGTIIFPYSSYFRALTCYTGTNFSGSSYNGYTTGSAGGFMKTLSDTELKNNFKSFKLKRGYMVTFATGTSGYGYSRCFVADNEDLEMNLPTVLSGKVSSYRLFQWYNFGKTGIANNTDATTCNALNVQGCYTYNVGGQRTPDVEWLSHKIHPQWPDIAACGSNEYSCTMKTDNEPANPSDDVPATVEEVLNYWEDAMRTGMRLCSPSAYDGSGNAAWFQAFFKAIDERGWRCDLYDIHCYWASFNNLYSYYNAYKRPLFISEWMWGASWNSNGSFANGVTDNTIQKKVSDILTTLNQETYVERYFYWNSESKAKIYNNGLTTLGNIYAASDGGLGYNKSHEYVPKVVIKKPHSLTGSASNSRISLKWSDSNGDMMDEIQIQYKTVSGSTWKTLATVARKDKTDRGDLEYTFNGTLENATNYCWRIADIYEGKTTPSDVLIFTSTVIDNASFIPANLSDFYFQFYSKEASTNLVWAVYGNNSNENRVYYKRANSNYASDINQLWIVETNPNNGYSFRNVGEQGFYICSPNSWNFITRNNDYTTPSEKTAFGLEYNASGNYWLCTNLAHGMYVGLWDNDKQFAEGEVLAGNRTNPTGSDSGDRLGIRLIPRKLVNDQLGIVTISTGDYYLYNPASKLFLTAGNKWDTQAIASESGISFFISSENNGFTLDSNISNGGTSHYLGNNLYCDSAPFEWIFANSSTIDGHQAYTISDGSRYISSPTSANTEITTTTNPNSSSAKWILLTRNELIDRMEGASAEQPINASFLIPGHNFGRNDGRIGNWNDNPTRNGYAQSDWGDFNGEKYNTTFDVYQEITDAPDGLYEISAQGFYRNGGYNEAANKRQAGNETLNALLYGNDATIPLPSIFSEANKCGTRGVNQSIYGYIPDSQTDASYYIHNGLYKTGPLQFVVENGKLRVGVKKDQAVTYDWSLFDNFKLMYLGPAFMLGDVNRDGMISITDVTALINIILGNDDVQPYLYDHIAADVNQDKAINIADAIALVNIILTM